MSQNLTLLSIEHEICEKLNCDNLIKDFAERKVCKINILLRAKGSLIKIKIKIYIKKKFI